MAMNLSQNMQDYLKAILLIGRDGTASTSDIAAKLEVSPASVTSMIKKLDELKLVKHESYRGVTLTHAGRKVALEILRHHRLIETYLAEALGYAWDQVHEEAERLEHHISEEFEDRISKILGDPQYDPHGDPIPSKDGRIPPTTSERLADAEREESVIIRRVSSHDNSMLRLLTHHGIGIGSTLRIVSRNEDVRSITVRHQRKIIDLSIEICGHIFVDRYVGTTRS
ncbi:MAG: metal-dependent transcriptional regulator [Ignavibacteria bacterium]|nr:metal-dependent transcriptional regulator [Ignavibacteria bacterium]MBK6418884.1 metal-dependent transcriptional regulator [Ignavibacteria bacterium]MBK7033821.1 metal-dependent transcriptional regulator [Ignavibacteria bacterium]MBK7186686.1 metal-dependent transcriptional regulator [Ignavibacteria bacterium]MBK7411790.1 metal-dependent transcriptional regulator [Ignavibacteria bacterium]